MIVNLWSTPRTGSVWYSHMLLIKHKRLDPYSVLMSEMFNGYHLNIYRKVEDGVHKNFHVYSPGCYYNEYKLDYRKCLTTIQVYSERVRNVHEEEAYRLQLLSQYNQAASNLILHNHTSPLSDGIYKSLFDMADENIFIGRDDFVQQLSSYAVAYATKTFANFREKSENLGVNLYCDPAVLNDLTNRILYWHTLDKTGCQIIKYENIDFSAIGTNGVNLPKKQNALCAYDKLCEETQNTILELKIKFDTSK